MSALDQIQKWRAKATLMLALSLGAGAVVYSQNRPNDYPLVSIKSLLTPPNQDPASAAVIIQVMEFRERHALLLGLFTSTLAFCILYRRPSS